VSLLPADRTARQREIEARERARMEAYDKAMAVLNKGKGATAPVPPKVTEDPRVTALAKAMGDKDYHLPTGSIANLTIDDDDEIIATGLTIEGRFWSVSDIVKLQLIDHWGAWLWSRYSAITHALPPVSNDYLRPCYPATVAGRAYERGGAIG
jgi:hypothetical protein